MSNSRNSSNFPIKVLLIAFFGLYFSILTFSDSEVSVVLEYDGDISLYWYEKSYWGFKEEWHEIRYFPETDNRVGGWYIQSEDGSWNIRLQSYYDDLQYHDDLQYRYDY